MVCQTIILDQFSMSLISSLASSASTSSLRCKQFATTIQLSQTNSKCIIEQMASIHFNGIVFRQRQLLNCLGIQDSLIKQADISSKCFETTSLSLSVRLIFGIEMDGILKIFLSQYNRVVAVKVQFVIIQRGYLHSNHQFTKINLIVVNSAKSIMVLLHNNAFHKFISLLGKKAIKFYIQPSDYFLQNYCSQNNFISLSCSNLLQNNKILYSLSCSFNGKQNCFAIFTANKIFILSQHTFLKQIESVQFKEMQYWIESQEDWISFKGRDHLVVFMTKYKQIQANNMKVQFKTSHKDNSQKPKDFTIQEESQEASLCKTERKNDFTFQCYDNEITTKKCVAFQQTREESMKSNFMIDQNDIIVEQSSSEIEPDQIKKCLSMIDQSQQAEKQQQKGADKQVDHQSLPQQNENTRHSIIYQDHSINQQNYYKRFYIEQKFLQERLHQTNQHQKQNCRDLSNKLQKHKIDNFECKYSQNSIESQSICKQKQQPFNIDNLQEHLHLHHPLNCQFENEMISQRIKRPKLIDICQISANQLIGLTIDRQLRLYKQLGQQYQEQQIEMKNIPQVSKMLQHYQNSILLISTNNLHVYNIFQGKSEELRLPFLIDQLKDAKMINDNVFCVLGDNSFHTIDRREIGCQKGINFKKNQFFQKMDIFSNTMAVGRSDGIVKLYDLRSLKPKSINNFHLVQSGKNHTPESLSNGFKQFNIMGNNSIFCQYGSSSFLIDAEWRGNSSIYSKTMKHSHRSFIKQYSIHHKIITEINRTAPKGQILFNINKQASSIVCHYKNYEFNFDAVSEKIKSWNRVNCKSNQQCFYIGFNDFSEAVEKIYGFNENDRSSIQAQQSTIQIRPF